ncbi:MAG TPA: MFS transporter [Polyangia bacterium]|jgi:ACS family hexuronate transporter-like MFS transporter|nr:MFS transporter [Polyangia bacterium]
MSTPTVTAGGSIATVVGRYRWLICSLLFLATTINYIDRQVLALIKGTLDNELGWTNAEYGAANSAFQGAYAVSLFAFGWFIDRFGVKIGYAVSIAAWSVAAAGHALVGSAFGFKVARSALGLGEGGNFPSSIKAVAHWFPRRERAFATALFNSGANVGAIVAPAIIPPIAARWGWRAAFVFMGIVGFAWLFLWLPFYDDPEKSKRVKRDELDHIRSDADSGAAGERPLAWGTILGYRQAWSFIVGKLLTDPVWWFFLTWLPDLFKKKWGLDIKKSWVHLVTIYAIITVLSIVGGWLTGALARRGWTVTRARKTGMFIFACFVLPIFFATRVGPWPAVVLIGIAGAAHQAWSANLFTMTSDMFPKRAVASLVGVGGMAGSLGGIAFPLLAGMLLDSMGTSGYAILFGICGSAYLVAFLAIHLLAPKFEPIEIPSGH